MPTKKIHSQTEIERLTPQEFKELVVGKKWTYRALALRWLLSETRISQIARDAGRPLYYDDAVRSLPLRET